MRDASTPKLELAVKKFMFYPFEVLLFLRTWRFDWMIWLDVF